MIDIERLKKINNQKRKSNAGLHQSGQMRSVSQIHHHHHPSESNSLPFSILFYFNFNLLYFKVEETKKEINETFDDASGITISVPDNSTQITFSDTPVNNIPPPWKVCVKISLFID